MRHTIYEIRRYYEAVLITDTISKTAVKNVNVVKNVKNKDRFSDFPKKLKNR